MVLRILLLLFLCLKINAQSKINGVLLDLKTIKPIVFAKIQYNNQIYFSDFDGKFEIKYDNKVKNLFVEAIGYENFEHVLEFQKKNIIHLIPKKELNYKEIENYKNSEFIIKKCIENSDKNNPQKSLKSFSYKSYQHLLVTANLDSLKGIIDTIYKDKVTFKIDSSDFKLKKYIEKQDLFQYEKISNHLFKDKLYQEKIEGVKMAGFDEPVYEAVGFVLQSLSVYEKYFEILGSRYLNPIFNNAPKNYLYKLVSVTSIQDREIYQVYFKPKNDNLGLEGLLYIDAETYAIAKTRLKIRDYIEIESAHFFEFFKNEKLWMPKKLDFKITKGNNNENISFLGQTIYFDQIDAINPDNKKYASDFMYVNSETQFYDHQFNQPINNKHQFISIEIPDFALNRNSEYWKPYSNNASETRKTQTYKTLDSIFKRNKVEKTLNFGRKIIDGYLDFGPIDLDLRHFAKYNNYEGLRLGIGGITNNKFSKMFKISGHLGYGFKDKMFKYKIENALRIGIYSDTWLQASYENDLKEIASTFFSSDPRIFTLYDSRPLNFTTFYNHKSWEGALRTNIIPYTNGIAKINLTNITPLYEYSYDAKNKSYQNYNLNIISTSFQVNPFSDFMQTPSGRIEIQERFPKFTIQFQQTVPEIYNDLVFSKIDFKTVYEKKFLNGMHTQLYFQSGISMGDVPASHLYNSMPNNPPGDSVFERLSFDANYGFETMFQNEFFSSSFIFIQAKHHFKKIVILEDIEPFIGIITRAGWGNIHNIDQHHFLDIKAHNKGYYESGLEFQNLYFGFGLGAYYRYGPYQFDKFEDNFSLKFNFKWDFWL